MMSQPQQQQVKQPITSKEKIDTIVECLKNVSLKDIQTTEKAFNNLTVLAREQSPNIVLEHPDTVTVIKECLEKNKQPEIGSPELIKACFRLISELSKGSADRACKLIGNFSVDYLFDIVCYSDNNDLLIAFQLLMQTIIDSLSGVHEKAKKLKTQELENKDKAKSVSESLYTKVHKKIDEETYKEYESQLFGILIRLTKRSSSYIISAKARDCLLELLMCNIDYQNLNFGVKLVEENCIQHFLDIASEVDDLKGTSSMSITNNTHSLVGAVLEKIYSCHDHDKVREIYREKVQSYLNTKLRNQDMEDKTRAAKIFTVLLRGPTEIGNSCIGQAGMVEMLIAMASSDDVSQQKESLDAIIAASIKKDKCAAFAKLGETVLNRLRESKNEDVRLRALVCLSKISSVGSTDAEIRPLGKQANVDFARDCRSILSRQTPEFKLKQYAIEALAFLSFDGDVKEELAADKGSLKALFECLLKDNSNMPVLYSILNIFVNLTNSYDKQETSPELVELAKFAKQHIPQEHPKDSPAIVKQRIQCLALTDLVSTLVTLENVSNAEKEHISRIINAMSEHEDCRGRIVQQGAVKLLLRIASAGTAKPAEKFVILSAHALARLGITINPEFVYPGQKMLAAVKQIRKLLHPDCTALQNFEALLSLTNIAQSSHEARVHILRDNGFSQIESLMFEEHDLVRRAAVECVVNIIREDDVISLYEADNDRVKYLVILCQEEDLATVKAASGALAMLCQVSDKACQKIFTANDWLEIFIFLLTHQDFELVHRAVVIIRSIMSCDNVELAKMIFESKLFEILMALTMLNKNTNNQQVPEAIKTIIEDCFARAKQLNIVKQTSDSTSSSLMKVSNGS